MTANKKLALFALSNKGGVGKTTLAKAFTDFLREQRLDAAVYDTDSDVRGLLKLYGNSRDGGDTFENDPIRGVGYFDMQINEERENVVNATETGKQILFFDTPAGSIKKIFTSMKSAERFVGALESQGYKPVLLILVDPYDDTIDGIQTAIDLFGDRVEYVIWKNMAHAESSDFIYFEPTSVLEDAEPMFADNDGNPMSARELVERYDGAVYEMPDLPLRTNARLRRQHLQFSDAVSSKSPLKTNDKALMRHWLNDLNAQFVDMLSKLRSGSKKAAGKNAAAKEETE